MPKFDITMIATYSADITISVDADDMTDAERFAREMESQASFGEFSDPKLFTTNEEIWDKASDLLELHSIDVADIEPASGGAGGGYCEV